MARKVTNKASRTILDAYGDVAKRFEAFKPAAEVLTEVRSVPTIFPQFDIATRVGGLPLQRVIVVHGPSNHGKTAFLLGLLRSYVERGHFGGLIDAEMTTADDWVRKMMGDFAAHPAFVASRPESYEETRAGVRNMVEIIKGAVDDATLPPDTGALIGLDSIGKLVPKDLAEKVAKAKDGVDGRGGRAGQVLAALNSAWLNELIPLLYHCNASMAIVAREAEKVDAQAFERRWKMRGGSQLIYDASLVLRIERADWVKHPQLGIVGEKHRIVIHKTKVGQKDDKVVQCHFYTSNGKLVPEGFDRARDVVELALGAGVVTRRGAMLTSSITGDVWKGENAAVKDLTDHPDILAELEAEARTRARPVVVKGDGIFKETSGDGS